MPSLAHRRGTRAQIDAAATANQLRTGELYLITDEGRLTVGTSINAHSPHAKQAEAGGTATTNVLRTPTIWTDFTTKNVVQNGFLGAANNAGTNTTAIAAANASPNHPGQWLLRSSTTANSGYRCMTDAELRIGGGEVFDFVFKTAAAFTNTTLRCGLLDAVSSTDAVDGCYLEFSGSGAIIGKTSSNSVRSSTATLATLAATTWYHARITVNADATSVLFEVLSEVGTLLGSASLTANIPTASGRETGCGFVVTNSGTIASDLLFADYMSFKQTRNLVRGAAG